MRPRRIREWYGQQQRFCPVCGREQPHDMIHSGRPRWRWFGAPVVRPREYLRCTGCGTRVRVAAPTRHR